MALQDAGAVDSWWLLMMACNIINDVDDKQVLKLAHWSMHMLGAAVAQALAKGCWVMQHALWHCSSPDVISVVSLQLIELFVALF